MSAEVPKAIARELLQQQLEERADELRARVARVSHQLGSGDLDAEQIAEARIAMDSTEELLDKAAALEGHDRWQSGRQWADLTTEERREVEQQ